MMRSNHWSSRAVGIACFAGVLACAVGSAEAHIRVIRDASFEEILRNGGVQDRQFTVVFSEDLRGIAAGRFELDLKGRRLSLVELKLADGIPSALVPSPTTLLPGPGTEDIGFDYSWFDNLPREDALKEVALFKATFKLKGAVPPRDGPEAFGMAKSLTYDLSTGDEFVSTAALGLPQAPIPEPGTWAMLAGGLGLLATGALRRKSH